MRKELLIQISGPSETVVRIETSSGGIGLVKCNACGQCFPKGQGFLFFAFLLGQRAEIQPLVQIELLRESIICLTLILASALIGVTRDFKYCF